MKKGILSFLLLIGIMLHAQDKSVYQLFDKNGKKVAYKKLLKAALETEVVLFGEYHNNPICHWLELELAKGVAADKAIVMGAEMFEADNQKAVNQYLAGSIDQKKLDSTARLWPNYTTDYKPLLDFAKDNAIKFVATNIPRRYASQVAKKGFEALELLSPEEKSWMAPLPMPYDASLSGYVNMMKMMGEHTSPNMPKAQASKDATMGYFIVQNLQPNTVFLHYNGTYHSDYFEGISWYLQSYKPGTKIITIATVEQKDIDKLDSEHYNKADFILVIDEDVTKSY
ncbi:ChaN family lipoprotein [Flavobacterium sp.]|uniref:ChaN family lipoprotein n=1 Tax=Flavobacterium sp. TaxID=239 RepID=UPI00262473C5|nr:ChaN family lipoprotein [Flavobacterium sp.]